MSDIMNRPIVTEKSEYRRGEFEGVVIKELPADPTLICLVSCPAKQYQPVSVSDCKACPFWYGFAPQKDRQNTMVSLCGFPVGRRITKVNL